MGLLYVHEQSRPLVRPVRPRPAPSTATLPYSRHCGLVQLGRSSSSGVLRLQHLEPLEQHGRKEWQEGNGERMSATRWVFGEVGCRRARCAEAWSPGGNDGRDNDGRRGGVRGLLDVDAGVLPLSCGVRVDRR